MIDATTIAVSGMSLLGTLGGTFGGILVSNKLTNYRIDQLEKKVQAHNNLIDRTYKLEPFVDAPEEKYRTKDAGSRPGGDGQ